MLRITQTLKGGNNLNLYAPRRYGKSSLVAKALAELINKQINYRKKVLYALSNAVNEVFSKSTAEKYRLGPVSTNQKALDTFIEKGMIERINNKYQFSDPIFKLFLQRNLYLRHQA